MYDKMPPKTIFGGIFMSTERDKFLTEAMGECWHIYKRTAKGKPWICWKCGQMKARDKTPKFANYFSTWEGFGKLWEWSLSQSWFEEFKYDVYKYSTYNTIHQNIICPNNLADSLYEFLKK